MTAEPDTLTQMSRALLGEDAKVPESMGELWARVESGEKPPTAPPPRVGWARRTTVSLLIIGALTTGLVAVGLLRAAARVEP